MAEGQKADVTANVLLQADLERGQLILGEATPAPKRKPKPESACTTNGAARIKPLGAENLTAGGGREGC
jgi:hypothetical protein